MRRIARWIPGGSWAWHAVFQTRDDESPPLSSLPQIPFCARSSCIKSLRFLLPPFSFFMSPEINLVIWIDSCVTWDYKTSYVLCGRSPLSTNLVVWVCVCGCLWEWTCWVAIAAAAAQGCWLTLDPIKVIRLFWYSVCWLELFPTGWNHNQFVFPQAGGSRCRMSVILSPKAKYERKMVQISTAVFLSWCWSWHERPSISYCTLFVT